MAFSSSSSRVSSFISSLIVLACLFQQRCHFIKADQALIDQVCEKTGNNRDVCQECFRNQEAQDLDIKGLSIFSISCSSTTSVNARQVVDDLGKRSTGSLKENCEACVGELDKAMTDYGDATDNVRSGKYNEGVNSLQNAHNKALDCLNLVGSGAVAELATLKGIVEVSTDVVHQIPN